MTRSWLVVAASHRSRLLSPKGVSSQQIGNYVVVVVVVVGGGGDSLRLRLLLRRRRGRNDPFLSVFLGDRSASASASVSVPVPVPVAALPAQTMPTGN
jgi:hypothetical protein